MPAAFDYFEMAKECMREAEAALDPARKKALVEIAQLYTQTATAMELATASPATQAE